MNLIENNIISILISLTLIYSLLSVFVSILIEWWNYFMRERGKMLKDAIIKLLSDPENHEYGHLFYGHFMISGLQSDSRPPQYISSAMFSEVLIDVIARQAEHSQRITQNLNRGGDSKTYAVTGAAPPDTVIGKFKLGIDMMNESAFKDMLFSFWDKSEGKYDDLKKLIAHWYDDYMDRVTGWYKSKQRIKLLIAGFIVAIGLNIDSLHLIKILSLDDNLRNTLVNTAESVADNYTKNSKMMSDSMQSNMNYLSILQQSIKTPAKNIGDSITVTNYKNIDSTVDKLRERISLFDSASVAYLNRADSVINLAASLGIPLGWSANTAPLSWLKRKAHAKKNSCKNEKCMRDNSCECKEHCTEHETCKKEKCCEKGDCCAGNKTEASVKHKDSEQTCEANYREGSGLWRYINARNNCTSCMSWMKYILGIFITGVSLSFGAPFWFEMLVKLVNIRRAGKKPGSVTDKK